MAGIPLKLSNYKSKRCYFVAKDKKKSQNIKTWKEKKSEPKDTKEKNF